MSKVLKAKSLQRKELKRLDTSSEIVEEYEEYISSEVFMIPALTPLPQEEHMPSCPEKNLLASAIERAILDLKSADNHERNSAYTWLTSRNKEDWSCLWMLEQLDIEPAFSILRVKVKQVKEDVAKRDVERSNGISRYVPGNVTDLFKV